MISTEQINEIAKRSAIDQFTIIKEYLQIIFLSALYSLKDSEKIFFKGGTAISLLLKSGRFSEDLDFTSELSASTLAAMVQKAAQITALSVPEVTVKKAQDNDLSYTAILNYQPEGMIYPLTIHLDFSLREQPETKKGDILETDLPIISKPIITHLDWPEILAEKIRALLYRRKGRDIYDLWFLLSQGIPLDWKLVNRKMAFYKLTASSEKVQAKIAQFDDQKLFQDLNKFLPAYNRGLITQLKNLTIEQLKDRESFTISNSKHLNYSTVAVSSFSSKDILFDKNGTDAAKITEIEPQDDNSLVIELTGAAGNKGQVYLRANDRNGVIQLAVIVSQKKKFIGLAYDNFIKQIIIA